MSLQLSHNPDILNRYLNPHWAAVVQVGAGSNSRFQADQGVFTFEAVEGGTRVTEIIEAWLGGFLRRAKSFIVRMFQREMESHFRNLKEILEGGA